MGFQNDIKKVLDEHGLSVMESVTLPNILADTSEEYNSNQALKNIFKDFFQEGNGKKVLELRNESAVSRKVKLKQLGDGFAKKNGYAFGLVNYLVSCLSYAMGWADKVEALESQIVPDINLSDKAHENPSYLKNVSIELKRKYLDDLENLYTRPQYKLFYVKPGYFSDEAISQLRNTENKIKLIAEALNDKNLEIWCKEQFDGFISDHTLPSNANRKRVVTRLGIPALIVATGVATGSGIAVSNSNSDAYRRSLATLSQNNSQKDPDQAFSEILDLNNEYANKFGTGSSIKESNSKLMSILNAKVSSLIAEGKYDEAIAWINSKKEQVTNNDELITRLSDKATKLEQEKGKMVESTLPELLNNIKTNGGKLDNSGKQKLQILLNTAPDNYWVKFLASKEL